MAPYSASTMNFRQFGDASGVVTVARSHHSAIPLPIKSNKGGSGTNDEAPVLAMMTMKAANVNAETVETLRAPKNATRR